VADSDGDGVTDYREQKDGTDPNKASSFDLLSKGLVAYYPFNGDANDESGFGNDAVNFGGVFTSARSLASLEAIALNGTNYLKAPSVKNIPLGSSARTLSVWAKSEDGLKHNNADHIANWGESISGKAFGVMLFLANKWWGYGHNHPFYDTDSGVVADTNWNHLVVTYSSGNMSVFVNGKSVARRAMVLNTTKDDFLIGVRPDVSWDNFFRGKIDDVRIYNRALSAAEVSQLYSKESENPNMVTVPGGTLPSSSQLAGQSVNTFQISKFETTWGEWKTVRDWAVANGYSDLAGVGQGSGDDHPVRNVSWYDVVKWCNAKSDMEGLIPVYTFNGASYKTGQNTPVFNESANGYRLPKEKEWEWAARGGVSSKGYTYSGSNNANEVAWFAGNSPGNTQPVGMKNPNDLGIYDMSGNVFEWMWDYYASYGRRTRGGGFYGGPEYCTVSHRNNYGPTDTYLPVHGFRLARNADVSSDTTAPVLAITSISANARLTSANATFAGTITETGSKPTLQYRLGTTGNWTASTVGGSASPYSFSQGITLKPGPNTVQFQAKDDAGNTSAISSLNVSYVVASTLTIPAPNAADGSVTSGFGGSTSREVGVSYTVRATPASGMVFKEWLKNGVRVSTNPSLTFKMEPGLKLTPVFAPDYAKLGGIYNGLVGTGAIGGGSAADRQAFAASNGFLQITLGTNGALSGFLRIEGKSHPFTGTMGGNKRASVTIPRAGKSAATATLNLISKLPGEISGNVTTGGAPLAFRALRAAYTAGAAKHALAGKRYAIVLPPPSGLAMGYGHATLMVEDNGAAVLSGVLANGQAVNAGARIVDDGAGNWVFPVYVGASSIFTGEIVIPKSTPASGSELGGSIEWLKPASNSGLFKSGFLKSLQPLGATHSPTSAGLGGAAFRLTLDPAKRILPAAVVQTGTWANSGSPSLTTPVKSGLTLSFNPLSGKFEGSFTRTVNSAPLPTPIQGTLFSRPIPIPGGPTLRGAGFFTSGNASTAVEITTP
jgi:formylglycine-generating enzyme required for sulfatase activity